tara:strand:- start:508 stop:1632 length:1125 start_codon:yes stop_codon:yes gene_type:complete
MQKKYISLGLMSGTSGDGVDASIIQSDGVSTCEVLKNKYFEYDHTIYNKFHTLKEKINSKDDLTKLKKDISFLEREITLFHAKIVSSLNNNSENLLIGFHGQTIYHNSREKISFQLGDGRLLSQLTKKNVVFNFRKKDLDSGGEGAPLAPIFHQLLATQNNFNFPTCILNIGGISNITLIKEPIGSLELYSKDIGPGNCLIDSWMRKNSNMKFDKDGELGSRGQINEVILENAQELYLNRIEKNKLSFDVNDFDISFARGLSLEDGVATLTDFTASILVDTLTNFIDNKSVTINTIFLCGGGRKNKFLVDQIKKKISKKIDIKLIDDYNLNGDFIESQAFAFIAIRRALNLPISFPNTTGCTKPIIGGDLIKLN